MIDKKAKRCDFFLSLVRGIPTDRCYCCSALSLRFFGEDITVAGVQAAKQLAEKASKPEEPEQDEAMVEDENAVEEVEAGDE